MKGKGIKRGRACFLLFLGGKERRWQRKPREGSKEDIFLGRKDGWGSASRGEMAKKTRTGWTSDRAREVDDREFKQLLDFSRILSWVSEFFNLVV